jgi:two-component system sensor histidine kinase ChvG
MALAIDTAKARALGLLQVLRASAKPRLKRLAASARQARANIWWLWRRSETKNGRHLSPLMLRILAVNVMALAILVGSLLYLGRYQDRIVAADLEALLLQTRMTASAVAEGAVVIGENDRSILSPLLARLMVKRLAETTGTRTRLFDLGDIMLADSRVLLAADGKAQDEDDVDAASQRHGLGARIIESLFDVIDLIPEREKYPLYPEGDAQQHDPFADIKHHAVQGTNKTEVWVMPEGGLMLAAAVPVEHYKKILGTVVLSHSGLKIDDAIRAVRLDILKIFAITLMITIALSLYLARAIARPVRLLAAAAEGLRHGQMQIKGMTGAANLLNREAIPDLTARHDEIGDLSGALRDLTSALAQRIGAIENFAADVAHEIKNPLTSLKSAVETAERVKDPSAQRRLMVVIRDDVDRLDRLLSDIANASRLDAELGRAEVESIDLGRLLKTLVDFYNMPENGAAHPEVVMAPAPEPLVVKGVEIRLVQVFQNLIDNALSFSPPGGKVRIAAARDGRMVQVFIDDEGPGIPENKLAAIFDRFYSERPRSEKFGTHSGLGLSIAKQIVEAHRGVIRAENRCGGKNVTAGARFIVQLPEAE